MTSNADEATLCAYRDTLEAALSDYLDCGGSAVVGLTQTLRETGADSAPELEALQQVAAAPDDDAAAHEAMAHFESPVAFREAVYFARCLAREPERSRRLQAFRRYAAAAVISADLPDLVTDRAAVLDASSFACAWRELGRIGWMLDTLQLWRRDFIFVYHARHASHAAKMRELAEAVSALRPLAEAVQRLNSVEGLGDTQGLDAIARVLELADVQPCGLDGELLAEALEHAPACPRCAYVLGQQASTAAVERLRRNVERALGVQQTRLARRVVSRLLRRPANDGGERLQWFIQVVQASDLTGLARVLDDALVDFLRGVIDAMPDDGDGVSRHLVTANPEVTASAPDAAAGGTVRLKDPSSASGHVW